MDDPKTLGHSTWNGCFTDRGTSTAPGTSAGYDQDVTAPTPSIPATLFPAEQYGSCPKSMMGLNYDWTAMKSLVESMSANGNTNQPIGLVWGWESLAGGGPFSVPSVDPNYQYQQVIILLIGRHEHRGSLVSTARRRSTTGCMTARLATAPAPTPRRPASRSTPSRSTPEGSDLHATEELRQQHVRHERSLLPADVGGSDRDHLRCHRHQPDQAEDCAIRINESM